MRETLRYKWLWIALTLLVTAAALFELLRPNEEINPQGDGAQLMHLIGFGLLALWYCALVARRTLGAVLAWLVIVGIGTEIAQHFMGLGRTGDVLDVVANVFGIAIGLGLSVTFVGRWPFWVERVLVIGDRK
ncbi:MAG: VanZ family protein [Pseudomonadota bacterium]